MIVYKLNQHTQIKADAQIKDMDAVLSEIPTTLCILRDLLNEHQQSISTKSIDQYRDDLSQMISEAIRISNIIAVNSFRLSSVSDQVAKQLAVFDTQIGDSLKGQSEASPSQQILKKDVTITQDDVLAPANASRFTKTFSRA